jgi:hypothetical protein
MRFIANQTSETQTLESTTFGSLIRYANEVLFLSEDENSRGEQICFNLNGRRRALPPRTPIEVIHGAFVEGYKELKK